MGSTPDVDVLVEARATLGEGPVWDVMTDRLLWVDIDAGLVHSTTAGGSDEVVFDAGETVGFVAPDSERKRYVIGLRHGLAVTTDWQSVTRVTALDDPHPAIRINDGKLDPVGRAVFGTLRTDDELEASELLSADVHVAPPPAVATTLQTGVSISNGLAWSADGTTMYYIDTVTSRLDAFDYDPATGAATNRRTVTSFDPDRSHPDGGHPDGGHPDGLTIDGEGALWIAFWGGSVIRRIAPTGETLAAIPVPATNPTSCAFGPDGRLYVTSAAKESAGTETDGAVFVISGL